ncbi:3'-5' exonuclease [Glutamicibacter ardleyensis]|uniref:3'-5' exonuclease n=1 Tax=Glutamicibacter ardleyensis TaxID=225894 RepID=UPI003FD4A722
MPFVSMASAKNKIDGSVKKQVMDFLQKLQIDDTTPGLHIEPMKVARDPRARTGRVNDFWRAVLFKMEVSGEAHYVYYGTWPHDKANAVASSTVLKLNLALGAPEFEDQGVPDESSAPAPVPTPVVQIPSTAQDAAKVEDTSEPTGTDDEIKLADPDEVLATWINRLPEQWDIQSLIDQVGIARGAGLKAQAARTQAELNAVVDDLPEAQGLVLLGLANGEYLNDLQDELGLKPIVAGPDLDEDEELDKAIRKSKGGFVFAGDNPEEVRKALEAKDVEAWRVFLHPEQRKYVEGHRNGSFRMTGGAGTGKTVVLIHRARALSQQNPNARILLTTFTKALSGSLKSQLTRLDPTITLSDMGRPGISVMGMDQIAYKVINDATPGHVQDAVMKVLGPGRNELQERTGQIGKEFRLAVDFVDADLPEKLLTPAFLEQEYLSVVLANEIVDEKGYLRVSRTGRGTSLNRVERKAIWQIFAQYRRTNLMNQKATFPELTAIAAQILRAAEARGEELPFDHVLVDEAQDFHATHWMLLRALAAKGPNDMFIAEDSHQRIYGQKITMSRFGIDIRGRSRRLRLNYRTTAENLAYAISILSGGNYTDLENEAESTSEYRSVRSGPTPKLLSVSSHEIETETVCNQLKEWIGQGSDPKNLAVLVRSEQRATLLATALQMTGIPYGIAKNGGTAGAGKVTVMTMHSSKGLEFFNVIVMGVGSDEIPAKWSYDKLPEAEQKDALMRERSLLYVAVTRARDELVLTKCN